MYTILGGDGKEYGPVSADQLKQWVREGRANALTQVRAQGATQWQALSSLPGLNDVFSSAPPPFSVSSGVGTAPEPAHNGDYELDIFGCVRRAFATLKNNLGAVLGAMGIYFGIMIVLGILGVIPIIGWLASIASWVVGGPLMGGLYYVLIRAGRNQNPAATDLIEGARKNFLQLFLGQLVTTLFVGLCMLPALVAALVAIIPMIINHQTQPQFGSLVAAGGLALLALPVVLWLTTNWLFTLPLIVDRNLEFWPAMKTSWRQVSRHWWSVFGLLVVIGLIGMVFVSFLGGLVLLDVFLVPTLVLKLIVGACVALFYLVGILLLMPINMGTIAQAYETIFVPRTPQPNPGA